MNALTRVVLISSFIFGLANCILSQTTLRVPSQYPTIQGAIDAAHPRDPEAREKILFTYVAGIIFINK